MSDIPNFTHDWITLHPTNETWAWGRQGGVGVWLYGQDLSGVIGVSIGYIEEIGTEIISNFRHYSILSRGTFLWGMCHLITGAFITEECSTVTRNLQNMWKNQFAAIPKLEKNIDMLEEEEGRPRNCRPPFLACLYFNAVYMENRL